MAIVGFGSLMNTVLPTLWDEDYLKKVSLQEGRSFEQLMGEVRVGLQALNGQLLGMPHYSSLFAVQDTPEIEYPIGVTNGFEEATEYGRPDPKRGNTTGHQLPIKPYDRAMGWTMMYLRKARAAKLDADVRSMIVDAKIKWQQLLLTRFFSSTAGTVGTTSSDVPFCDAGSADSTYVPLQSPEGEAFLYIHEHFLDTTDVGITSNTIDQTGIEVAIEHLQEHGHNAPFDIIGARVDASNWSNMTNVTGWKPPDWGMISYHNSAVERAAIPDVESFHGYIETEFGVARLWLTPRLPTYNYGVFKSYGPGDQRNPLRVRIDRNVGFGFNLVPGNWVNAPTEYLLAYTEFGVGVGADRTNGVCVDLGASTWAAPTIS